MKVIYVAGKCTGMTYSETDDNIRKAKRAAIKLWSLGWAVICPHLNSFHFNEYECLVPNLNYDLWIQGSLEILKRCDAIFMLTEWADSNGAALEQSRATANTIPIFYEDEGYPDPKEIK